MKKSLFLASCQTLLNWNKKKDVIDILRNLLLTNHAGKRCDIGKKCFQKRLN